MNSVRDTRVRAVGTIIFSALASGLFGAALIAGMVHLKLGIQLGPYQEFEFIVILVSEAVTALGTAVILAIVLLAGDTESAVRRTAIVLALFLVTVLAVIEVFGLATQSGAGSSRSNGH